MGVRGLTTYINYNENAFLHQYYLHDCSVVIDGHSLCAQLYRALNCFSAFGGDYDKYAYSIRNFFKNLKKCNVRPYLLFDGSYEARKLKTAYNRLRSKIYGASRLDPVTQGTLHIFPLLLRDVFIEVIIEMKVPFTVCEFEADDEIAAMARHLKCPVLSYDSDFFIYNVLYIPFNQVNCKPKPFEENDTKFYALECKIYRTEYLTAYFGGLSEELLPLLATLLGNDFVQKRVFSKFFSQLKLPKSKSKKNEQQRCIHGLFKWLQNETLDSAITKILGRLKKQKKDKVFNIIKKSISGYSRTDCRSLEYFNLNDNVKKTDIDLQLPDDNIDHSDDSDNDAGSISSSDDENSNAPENDEAYEEVTGLSDWFAKKIRNNCIPKPYINLYTHHLYFCSPQAEDYTEEDSFLCTLPILRYGFDILTDYAFDNCLYVSRENQCNYKRILVGRENAVPRLLEQSFGDMSTDNLKLHFNHFINQKFPSLDLSLIDLLPNNFQICMIAMTWWVIHCKVSLAHIHSLFLCYLMLEVIDEKTGTFRGHNHFNDKYSMKLAELRKRSVTEELKENEYFVNKNKVQYEDCLIAASVLLKHFEMDDSIRKKPKSYDSKKMHTFAQFQCCLLQFNSLNTLCREPFECTKYSKCFNGTFAYNIVLKLENQVNPVQFIEQYLKGATSVLMFYKSLWSVYERLAVTMGLTTVVQLTTGKKRRRRRKGTTDEDEVNFIVKGFESEVII